MLMFSWYTGEWLARYAGTDLQQYGLQRQHLSGLCLQQLVWDCFLQGQPLIHSAEYLQAVPAS